MNESAIEELITVLTEDFTVKDLSNVEYLYTILREMLGYSEKELIMLVKAALAVKNLRPEHKTALETLLIQH